MDSPAVAIREFRFPQDYQQIFTLWESMEKGVRVGRSDSLSELEKKIARDPDLFLLAEQNKAIVGSVIGGYDGRRGLVYHLAVLSSHRGRALAPAY